MTTVTSKQMARDLSEIINTPVREYFQGIAEALDMPIEQLWDYPELAEIICEPMANLITNAVRAK